MIKMVTVWENFDVLFDKVKGQYKWLENQNKKLIKENKELKSEHYKDLALQEMKAEVELAYADLRRGFGISEKEEEELYKLFDDHCKTENYDYDTECKTKRCPKHQIVSYSFYPTELGTFKSAFCRCGKELRYNDKYI